MSDMVENHTKDVAEFQRESESSKDPQAKEFASKTLPILQDPLKEAKEIAPTTTASTDHMGSHQWQDQLIERCSECRQSRMDGGTFAIPPVAFTVGPRLATSSL
jgi:hypothetical protein